MQFLYLSLTTVLFLRCFINCNAFNLDTDHAIVKEGDEGSLFGLSVALHKQVLPEIKSILLVGAPQAEALPGQAARRSGGVYACPITQHPRDCSRLIFDDHFDPSTESKENQWMGVIVRSQGPGGKVLACAHRYEQRDYVGTPEEIRSPTGRCYVLGQALGLDAEDEAEGGGWQACSGRDASHTFHGFCQQGTAAGFTRDYHYLYFGAPGAHHWRGMVYMAHRNSSLYENGIFDDGPYETDYPSESGKGSDQIEVPFNSYMGFSVDAADGVTRRGEASVAAGAPRLGHAGAVLLLAIEGKSLAPRLVLHGEKIASAYGYAVSLVDVNRDGWTDLLVGAPYFSDQSKNVGGAVYVYLNDNGRFHPGHGDRDSGGGGDSEDSGERRTRVRLDGTAGSGFGLTIAAIGDVDLDGFQDVAVGAPFEGSGRVYIYNGGPSGIITKPAQVLAGENFGAGLHGFGYSLSGSLDVDGNLYPDLLVGSLSDQVILFRSRTVITVDVRLVIDGDIDVNVKNCENRKSTCVRVLACFSYWARPSSYSLAVTLRYSLDADEGRRRQGLSSRVLFTSIAGTGATAPPLGEHLLSADVLLRGQDDKRCFNATLRVHDHVKDKLRAIPLHLHYEVRGARRSETEPAEELLPVLNASVANPVRTEVNFVKEGCGEDKICQSELSLSFSFCSHIKSENFTQLRSEAGRPVFLVGQHEGLALNVSVRNAGDDAHETHLVLVLPPRLRYRGFRHNRALSQDVQPLCLLSSNASVVDCELGNPLKRGYQVLLYLILSTEGVTKDTLELSSSLQLTTTSEQEGLEPIIAKVKVLLEMNIVIISTVRPSQVYFGGEIRGESVIRWEGAAGSLVEYNITVLNLGHPLEGLGGAYVDIHFPVEMSNGKWLLYLVALELSGAGPAPGGTGAASGGARGRAAPPGTAPPRTDPPTCHGPQVDELMLKSVAEWTLSTRGASRKKTVEKFWKPPSLNNKGYAKLDCAEGTVRCWRYRCPLAPGTDKVAQIGLRARLWNSTFLEEYPEAQQVDVVARVHVGFTRPLPNLVIKGAKPEGQPVRVTVLTETPSAAVLSLPWWIILLTVLAGILLLALLILLLWKCGFFKRTTEKMQYEPVYHRAHLHTQPSERQRLGLGS